MDDELPFIQEIRNNPHDETARLVYADFLEEAGDPRSELIRVQCQLAHLATGDPARTNLHQRERELLDSHAEDWLEPLRALGAEGVSAICFQRGLIERARISARKFLANGEELCRIAPAVHCLDLRRPQDALDELVTSDIPHQITQLDLSANRLEADAIAALKSALWMPRLASLNLQFNRLGNEGVSALLSVKWPRLEQLHLGANQIGGEGMQMIVDALVDGTLESLTTLALPVNSVGDGIVAFDTPRGKTNLVSLDLASNGIGFGNATALARSPLLKSLKQLILRGNRVGTAAEKQIRQSLSLEVLDLRNNQRENVDVV